MNGFVDRCDENKEKKGKRNRVYPRAFFLMKSLWELLFNQSLGNSWSKYKTEENRFSLTLKSSCCESSHSRRERNYETAIENYIRDDKEIGTLYKCLFISNQHLN